MQTTDTLPRRATNGDETDVLGPGRKQLACLVNHPSGIAATKRRIRRRERREGSALLRVELAALPR